MCVRSGILALAALAPGVASAVLVVPSTVAVTIGTPTGGATDLALTDGLLFTASNPAPGLGLTHSSWSVVGNFAGLMTIGNVEIVERMVGLGQYRRSLEAFNWVTNAYDVIDVRPLQPGVTTTIAPITGLLTNYRNTANDLRVRVRVIQAGPSFLTMTHQVDRLNWDL